MEPLTLTLKTIEGALEFVKQCSEFKNQIEIPMDGYSIDAKSILGIMSIDLRNKINVIIHTEDEDVYRRFVCSMTCYR